MAPLASMIASAVRCASARSLSLAARSGNAGRDLILGKRLIAALRPLSSLTGDAPSKRPLQLFGCAHHGACRPLRTRSFHGVSSFPDQPDEFVAQEEDMASDEALWALYHRWCKHFKMERDHDDMVRRFGEFKKCVLRVHEVNIAGLSYRLAINKDADTSVSEKTAKRPAVTEYQLFRAKALGGFSISCGPSADD